MGAAGALLLVAATGPALGQPTRASKLGEYRGYSRPVYDGWRRTSLYIAVRDGTRLAADIYRPTRRGRAGSQPLPVVWEFRRYYRALVRGGRVRTTLDGTPWLKELLRHGYVLAVVDVRGAGASFGSRNDPTPPVEALDAYDVTEWLASQRFCNGRVGMQGVSYGGAVQFLAAGSLPPHLVAICPRMAMFDLYDFSFPGGVLRHKSVLNWGKHVRRLDLCQGHTPAPVDDDCGGTLLAKALLEHQRSVYPQDLLSQGKAFYRDSVVAAAGKMMTAHSPSSYAQKISKGKVAVYLMAGWRDMFPRDMLLWYANLGHPKRIVVGPWNHYDTPAGALLVEHLRWYDCWLKGVKNGIADEPPIFYYTAGAPKEKAWQSAKRWPPLSVKPAPYYFHAGPSGSIRSVNDGTLTRREPDRPAAVDRYRTDYSTTSGTRTRWGQSYGQTPRYPDMRPNDRKALTYTTAPLDKPLTVTGHPIVHLWVTSSARDGDFFVYLEDVDRSGGSHYVTEGVLRASHRATVKAPHEMLGLPYHRSFAADVAPLGDGPAELAFDLHPTSSVFHAGHRIRVSITCADRDNAVTPRVSPPPTVCLHRDAEHPSRIVLPLAPPFGDE
jgi:hypothetical protein